MSAKYEKNIYLAMLAEQCSRFDEMVDFLEDLLKSRDDDLNSDERNLLSIAYKNSISGLRTAIRTTIAYETKESKKSGSNFLPYIKEYKQKLETELTAKCQKIIQFIDSKLIPKAKEDEAKVFYIKMKGDYYRYIAEYAEGDEKEKVANGAMTAYEEAQKISKGLPTLNPIALGLILNFSVFYYEVKNDRDTAIKLAEEAVAKAEPELANQDEENEELKDVVSIFNLLKENLEMWKNPGDE